jgi:hypothetical protein
MKLSKQDAEIFFRLMWSLQSYVNLNLEILPKITTIEDYVYLTSREKLPVRDALYDNKEIIDMYLKDNPQDIPQEELNIIKGWKKFVRGEFFIERFLKKHTIFIGDDKVYGVLALYESFEELLPFVRLPHYTKAVLLPYKSKIVYDGVLEGYHISFGSGIRSELKETYMAAKQNGRIVESFESVNQLKEKKPSKDWRPTIDGISLEVDKLRSTGGAPSIQGPVFSLAKASIEFTKTAVHTPDNLDELRKSLQRVRRAIRKIESTLDRTEYYRNS